MEKNTGERDTKPRDSEAKFASPKDNAGVGYYDEHGNQLSPEEFSALVARDDGKVRDEDDDG